MRKFAAHYLVSDTGVFLKNGMVVAGEDGLVAYYIDTKGDLRETEQLIFHNGILMAGYSFTKVHSIHLIADAGKTFRSSVLQAVGELTHFSMQDHIDLAKELQIQFPEMKIPAIMNGISEILLAEGGFSKEIIPGIFLLTSVDLVDLHFTPKSRLKKIL